MLTKSSAPSASARTLSGVAWHRREDQHRQGARLPQLLQDVEAVRARQHQVEDREVEPDRRGPHRDVAVAQPDDLVAGAPQRLDDLFAEPAVVFDDEDARGHARGLRGTSVRVSDEPKEPISGERPGGASQGTRRIACSGHADDE
ncbi:MAG: hypothetical protein V9G22_09875 [Ottowia sp.]